MRRIFTPVALIAGLIAGTHVGAQEYPADAAVSLSAPVSLTNGKTVASINGWKLRRGQTVVGYIGGEPSFCGSPDDRDAGWQVEMTMLAREGSGGAQLRIAWQRLSKKGLEAGPGVQNLKSITSDVSGRPSSASLFNTQLALEGRNRLAAESAGRLGGSSLITLQPGDKVTLDYISANPTTLPTRSISPEMAAEIAHLRGSDCHAIGMALEIQLDRPATAAVLETDLWLVRRVPNAADETQHQLIRGHAGDVNQYLFDAVAIPVAFTTFDEKQAPRTEFRDLRVTVSGTVRPIDFGDGKVHMDLKINRLTSGPAPQTKGPPIPAMGNASYEVVGDPGEVVSFNLPPIATVGEPRSSVELSLRVRAHWLK